MDNHICLHETILYKYAAKSPNTFIWQVEEQTTLLNQHNCELKLHSFAPKQHNICRINGLFHWMHRDIWSFTGRMKCVWQFD